MLALLVSESAGDSLDDICKIFKTLAAIFVLRVKLELLEL